MLKQYEYSAYEEEEQEYQQWKEMQQQPEQEQEQEQEEEIINNKKDKMENRFRFRALIKSENKIYDVLSINYSGNIIEDIGVKYPSNNFNGTSEKYFNIKDCVLMQSTGLTDSEGKDIFEKDILTKDGLSFVVEFIEGGFVIKQLFSTKFENGRLIEISEGKIQSFHEFNSMKEYKIVGNSFENKELLGE